MPYPYGAQSLPAAVLAPGLPRRQMAVAVGDTLGFPAKVIIARADQQIKVPDWATYARMGATGKGGNGLQTDSGAPGGGGGGFAGTNLVKVQPGLVINVRFTAAGTVIEGLGYLLIGGNGTSATAPAASTGGPGGIGTGGDVNFTGGTGGGGTSAGGLGGGGGAASRAGNGLSGQTAGSLSVTGTNGTAPSGYLSGGACGGGGLPLATFNTPTTVGTVITVGTVNGQFLGGDGGGGGGGTGTANVFGSGGNGLALIEFW